MAGDMNGSSNATHLRISDLSRLTGIPVSTLRYWCDQNLLSPHVTPSGHRLFEERHVGEVQSIQRLRKVQGLSITAVKSAIPAQAPQKENRPPATAEGDKTGETGEAGTVGQKLRQLRLNAKLTLRDVSQATGLSQSVLASIERTSLGVGIPEARALAKYFGVTLTELMTREPARGSSEYVTSAAGGPMEATLGSGLRIERLASGRDMMDCQRWYIEPGVGSHGAYDHEGEEFIYVLLGRLSLAIEGRATLTLAQGESIYFRSSLRHSWHNPGNTTTVLLWVNTPPTF
jgi:DNA-binding transcriptional MerR regulator/mannose-6-phosphate isomerase-like protein (cupin superfamily)